MWFGTTAATMHEGDGPEFFTLLLGATLGMALMASTSNLLMLFMAVEMASLPSYVLAGFRKTHRIGAEASLKYVLFGAATSAIMVYGLSMLYGLYGTLQLDADRRRRGAGRRAWPLGRVAGAAGDRAVRADRRASASRSRPCRSTSGARTSSRAPASTSTTFLSVASKGAALVLLLRVLMAFADGARATSTPGGSPRRSRGHRRHRRGHRHRRQHRGVRADQHQAAARLQLDRPRRVHALRAVAAGRRTRSAARFADPADRARRRRSCSTWRSTCS